jgi:hypothetical protein
VHSLSWAPLLFDYKAVDKHDTSTLDNWTIDGDYLYKNFGSLNNVEIIDDSDKAFLASWGPLHDRPQSLKPRWMFQLPYYGHLLKQLIFNEAFYGPIFDPLKRQIFYRPVYWHARPLNHKWKAVDTRASDVLSHALKQPGGTSAGRLMLRIAIVIDNLWINRRPIKRRLFEVASGDRIAIKRVIERLSEYGAFVIGKRQTF